MRQSLTTMLVFALLFLLAPMSRADAPGSDLRPGRPRLVILTDIGGDPDDQQSLVRLLLYSNQFDIEGLVASASGTPGELKQAVTRPELIRQLVEAYGKVRPNLLKHADGYPTADALLAVIKSGNPQRGQKSVGDKHDTEGSKWIIAAADHDDPRPLNIAVWGGQTDLAQALWRVKQDRGPAGYDAFVKKLRVYEINDQDRIGDWMHEQFPLPFLIRAQAPDGKDKRLGAYRGIYLGGEASLVSREWMESNIRQDHGPLGALYPPKTWTAPNPHSAIKEGDTPSWFYFLPTGLSDPSRPDWGGWGGRFQKNDQGIWRDAIDTVDGVAEARATVFRWRPAFQADFAARLDWCVKPPAEANHAPMVVLNGAKSLEVVRLAVRSGEPILLSAAGTTDPDAGQSLSYHWWVYREAGTYDGDLGMPDADATKLKLEVQAPQVSRPQTVHLILEVTDSGSPALRGYRRAVVTVEPK